jgi:hypothetical protein
MAAKAKAKTTDRDLGYRRIRDNIDDLDKSFTQIGVQGTRAEQARPIGDATNAEIAFYNEFGTENIPERSFIRSAVDEDRSRLERKTEDLINIIMLGAITPKKVLDKLGFDIKQLIKNKIVTLDAPPNAPSTIRKKGFNNPLIETRTLWRLITFKTVMK